MFTAAIRNIAAAMATANPLKVVLIERIVSDDIFECGKLIASSASVDIIGTCYQGNSNYFSAFNFLMEFLLIAAYCMICMIVECFCEVSFLVSLCMLVWYSVWIFGIIFFMLFYIYGTGTVYMAL